MTTKSEELERTIDHVGELEGAPAHVIDEAKVIGRHLLFFTPPSKRVSPARAQNIALSKAADWIRKRTCRSD